MALREKALRLKAEAEALLANYIEHRWRGELWKAGEYLWAALQALLMAIAFAKGRELAAKHGAIRRFVDELADIMEDPGIRDAFRDGERLHANFYHPGLLDDEEVREAILRVEGCIDKLAHLLERELGAK